MRDWKSCIAIMCPSDVLELLRVEASDSVATSAGNGKVTVGKSSGRASGTSIPRSPKRWAAEGPERTWASVLLLLNRARMDIWRVRLMDTVSDTSERSGSGP